MPWESSRQKSPFPSRRIPRGKKVHGKKEALPVNALLWKREEMTTFSPDWNKD